MRYPLSDMAPSNSVQVGKNGNCFLTLMFTNTTVFPVDSWDKEHDLVSLHCLDALRNSLFHDLEETFQAAHILQKNYHQSMPLSS